MKDLGPNRLRSLHKLKEMLNEGERKHHDLEKKWDELLEAETGSCVLLNVLYSQITLNEEVTKAIQNAIQKIKMELSN